jgi:hypothetical protein
MGALALELTDILFLSMGSDLQQPRHRERCSDQSINLIAAFVMFDPIKPIVIAITAQSNMTCETPHRAR